MSTAAHRHRLRGLGLATRDTANAVYEDCPITILNWNILAPGLLLFFWRGSYGLDLLAGRAEYDALNTSRLRNMKTLIEQYRPTVVTLQEVTNVRYAYLGDRTMQAYLADELGYRLINESFKKKPFNYDYPPREQTRGRHADSGVATLVRNDTRSAPITSAGKSTLFADGSNGSPYTVDRVQMGSETVYVANVHIRMEYPHIARPLQEVYDGIRSALTKKQLENTVVLGDFNAGNKKAATDLFRSPFYEHMFDERGHTMELDHVFVGNDLRRKRAVRTTYVPSGDSVLEMNLNRPAVGKQYRRDSGERYQRSVANNALIQQHSVTSDHEPMLVEICTE